MSYFCVRAQADRSRRPEARAYKLQGFGRSANQQQITIDKKEGGGPTPAQRASAAALGKKLPPETKKQCVGCSLSTYKVLTSEAFAEKL